MIIARLKEDGASAVKEITETKTLLEQKIVKNEIIIQNKDEEIAHIKN